MVKSVTLCKRKSITFVASNDHNHQLLQCRELLTNVTDELEGDIKRVVDKQGSLTDNDGDDEFGNDGGGGGNDGGGGSGGGDDAVNCNLL